MSSEQIRKIIDDSYDDSKEETLRGIVREFYSRRLLSTVILVWGWAIAFIALAAYSATQFFKVDQTRGQIMYAALFLIGAYGVGLMKIFAWEMLHRSSIRRDLRRVELRVAELGEMLKDR